MKKIITALVAISLVSSISGCASHKIKVLEKRQPMQYKSCNAEIFEKSEDIPKDSKLLAKAAFGDSGLTEGCGMSDRHIQMKKEACGLGANIIKINVEGMPNAITSTCYRAKVSYYYSPSKKEESPKNSDGGKVKRLQDAKKLLDEGIINQEEFNSLKQEIINEKS